jgi:hypothetical protein
MAETLAGADPQGRVRLDLELVYGHSWGRGPGNNAGDFRIDANRIPLRR